MTCDHAAKPDAIVFRYVEFRNGSACVLTGEDRMALDPEILAEIVFSEFWNSDLRDVRLVAVGKENSNGL